MQVQKVNDNTAFGVKISPHFHQVVQNHYNYNQVPNKLKRMYEFNQKIEQYSNFGFDNYSLDYEQKFIKGRRQHLLVAITNDGNKKVEIFNRNTLAKIIDSFMRMTKHEFSTKFKNQ
jgi:hypothetical protein